MDEGKFQMLFEYATDGKAEIDRDALVQVCTMYMDKADDADAQQQIQEAAATVWKAVCGDATEISKEKLLESMLSSENALKTLLAAESNRTKAKETGTLNTIMSAELSDGDDEDAEVEEEEVVKTEPILRGVLKLKDGKLNWSGKWAMSKELWSKGEKCKFRYVLTDAMPASGAAAAGGGQEHPAPIDGTYNGHFQLKDESVEGGLAKVVENGVKFTFSRKEGSTFECKGEGKNNFGAFALDGVYDRSTGRLSVVKRYAVSYEDDEIDDDDDSPEDAAAELKALQADAEVPIEELRKRFGSGGGGEPPPKRVKDD